MIKTQKITYKVFVLKRVKKKVKFFDMNSYPLQIRLTAGVKTLYFKSYFFGVLQHRKYLHHAMFNATKISIDDIICTEEQVIKYVMNRQTEAVSLDLIKLQYHFFSYDILHEMDEQFRKFLVDFFYLENLPAYSLFIKNDGNNYTCEFVLDSLERSLQPFVYMKLLHSAIEKAPPYIPFIRFFREQVKNLLPVFPAYQWQETFPEKFTSFITHQFPEYSAARPAEYINELLNDLAAIYKIPLK